MDKHTNKHTHHGGITYTLGRHSETHTLYESRIVCAVDLSIKKCY